jgi:hypothetical protein
MRAPAPALALVALLALVACSWSVPADPGENARLRSRAVAPQTTTGTPSPSAPRRPLVADDPGTRALYERKCGQCHEPFPPTYGTAGDWPGWVRKYGPRAGLFGAERQTVLAWLQRNAR